MNCWYNIGPFIYSYCISKDAYTSSYQQYLPSLKCMAIQI